MPKPNAARSLDRPSSDMSEFARTLVATLNSGDLVSNQQRMRVEIARAGSRNVQAKWASPVVLRDSRANAWRAASPDECAVRNSLLHVAPKMPQPAVASALDHTAAFVTLLAALLVAGLGALPTGWLDAVARAACLRESVLPSCALPSGRECDHSWRSSASFAHEFDFVRA